MQQSVALLTLLLVWAAAESPDNCDFEASGMYVCCALHATAVDVFA